MSKEDLKDIDILAERIKLLLAGPTSGSARRRARRHDRNVARELTAADAR
jgi:hypothetical protein